MIFQCNEGISPQMVKDFYDKMKQKGMVNTNFVDPNFVDKNRV